MVSLLNLLDPDVPATRIWEVSPIDKDLLEQLEKAVSTGSMKYCDPQELTYAMAVFTVPKTGGVRLVYNATALNAIMFTPEHFRHLTLPLILNRVEPSHSLIKFDCKNAFWQIGLDAASQQLMGIILENGLALKWTTTPFGSSWSPVIFSAFLAPILDEIRAQFPKIQVWEYLDDILVSGEAKDLTAAVPGILRIFASHNVILNNKKTVLVPRKEIEFLGFFPQPGTPGHHATQNQSKKNAIPPSASPYSSDVASPSISTWISSPYGLGMPRIEPTMSRWRLVSNGTDAQEPPLFSEPCLVEPQSDLTILATSTLPPRCRDLNSDFFSLCQPSGTRPHFGHGRNPDPLGCGSAQLVPPESPNHLGQLQLVLPRVDQSQGGSSRAVRFTLECQDAAWQELITPDRQPSSLLVSGERNSQELKTGADLLSFLDPCALSRHFHSNSVDPNAPERVGRYGLTGNALLWYRQINRPAVQSLLHGNLAPSTKRLYASTLKSLCNETEGASLVEPDAWLKWISTSLDNKAPSTVAQSIKTAQAALYVEGVDLASFYGPLNTLLSKLSARIRKKATGIAANAKNTDVDKRPLTTVSAIFAAFLSQTDSTILVPSLISTVPKNLAEGLMFALTMFLCASRLSDAAKLILYFLDSTEIVLVATNWKLTSNEWKQNSPTVARMLTTSVSSFLSHGKNAGMYTHMFRVSHASAAVAAKIPIEGIMERVDWKSASMVQLYARTVACPHPWNPDGHYEKCLGF